jgi:SAM-dependent methyltransferase
VKGAVLRNFDYSLARALAGCDSVLDLGCGPESPIARFPGMRRVGAELFEPYLRQAATERHHEAYVMTDLRHPCFRPESFDAVVLLDVLEHLTREDGERLLAEAVRLARRKVIVFTPNGFLPQEGYHENPYQRHLSGWSTEELEALGFAVSGVYGWRRLRGEKGAVRFRPPALWRLAAGVTQLATSRLPVHAFHLFALLEKARPGAGPGTLSSS